MIEGSRPVALVTGAAGNIATAIALAFASAGYDLVLHHRASSPAFHALVEEAGRRGAATQSVQADLREPAEIRRVFATLGDSRLDVLVNCAGTYAPVDFLASTPEDWLASYSLHVVSAVTCIQQAVLLMQHGGAIINIASIAAHRSPAEHGPYAASKAALLSLTRSAALALADRGIRVNAVSPGLVWREGLDTAWPDGVASWRRQAPLGVPIQPDEVGGACLFLAEAGGITGEELVVDAGISVQADY
ncbi:SDR family NAD(P)-dependent oxidoreductase [Nocardioides astragali]|uniref:SDR family NAD(P)-dependent oxidoreductase n=1 Tax=Nocardioides astragali TaxID=1776736 RepID=A0ABW2N917_9ACTN|nr:SDR family oxidoreductase [Nocardioides astragali]